ncbi:MAG: trimethylamine methyltransferase family protein [Anaerolineales bacterium]|nr:trimethylamine methyltransferase family protein [Anaerolineales bacterium]
MLELPIIEKENLDRLHNATLQVLSETGIKLSHPETINLLIDHGATRREDRILMPVDLVEYCISLIETKVYLQGRDPLNKIDLSNPTFFAHNVGGVPNVFELKSQSRRPAARADNITATRLLDALPNVSSITPLYTPQDVPGAEMTLWMSYDTLNNTTKPFRAPGMQTGDEVKALSEMVQIACPDGKVTVGISPVSPLSFPDNIVEAIVAVARSGFIFGPLPCPILGATSPMSIAGGLVQQNAEVLASVIIAQLVRPGTPVIYKGRLSVMDPRTGLSIWGNPEIGLISAATVDLAHYYGMPADIYGLCTNAHNPNFQSGYERAFNALMPVLAGADEISGIGELESGLSSSLTQIVLDDEILSSIHRLQRGFEIDDDSLGVEVINNAMNGSQNYLAQKHTVQYLRRGEILDTQLAARETWSQWDKAGRQDILDRAQEKANNLGVHHEVPPLRGEQIAELERLIRVFGSEHHST